MGLNSVGHMPCKPIIFYPPAYQHLGVGYATDMQLLATETVLKQAENHLSRIVTQREEP
jgi:hypothetical protein